jgi:PPP family 3-phenylpropionic acid transporter
VVLTGQGDFRFGLGYFILFSIYGVITPFLQVFLKGLGYGPSGIGLFLGLFEAMGILGPLWLSRKADRSGHYRPYLAAAALMAALPAIPMALARNFLVTAPCIAIMALGVRGMVPVMDASVIAHTSAHTSGCGKSRGYGTLRSAGTAGFIVMLLATQAFHLERGSPILIALWITGSALVLLLFLIVLPESGRAGGREADPVGPSRSSSTSFVDPLLIIGLVIMALGRLAMSPINSFFTLYATDRLQGDTASLLWALAALVEIPALIVSGRLIARFGPMRIIALANAVIVLRLGIYALVPSFAGALVAQLLHFFCFGLYLPAAIAFVGARVPPDRRAWGMALLSSLVTAFPGFIGSTAGGFILEAKGYQVLFAVFTIPALVSLVLWFATRKRYTAPA